MKKLFIALLVLVGSGLEARAKVAQRHSKSRSTKKITFTELDRFNAFFPDDNFESIKTKKINTATKELFFEVFKGNLKSVNKANAQTKSVQGSNLLAPALLGGSSADVEKLMKTYGLKLLPQTLNGVGAVYAAIAAHNPNEMLKLIKSKGMHLNLSDMYGTNCIISAAGSNNLTMVKELQKEGASINFKDKRGETPLMLVAQAGLLYMVKILIAAGANLNIQDTTWKQTALIKASWQGHTNIVQALLAAKANFNIQDKIGQTALMKASRQGDSAIVHELITAGASLNIQDKYGFTALMIAVMKGNEDTVKLLVNAHANINSIKNKYHQTALRVAKNYKRKKIITILEDALTRR